MEITNPAKMDPPYMLSGGEESSCNRLGSRCIYNECSHRPWLRQLPLPCVQPKGRCSLRGCTCLWKLGLHATRWKLVWEPSQLYGFRPAKKIYQIQIKYHLGTFTFCGVLLYYGVCVCVSREYRGRGRSEW